MNTPSAYHCMLYHRLPPARLTLPPGNFFPGARQTVTAPHTRRGRHFVLSGVAPLPFRSFLLYARTAHDLQDSSPPRGTLRLLLRRPAAARTPSSLKVVTWCIFD